MDLVEVFKASPIIYSVLLLLSLTSFIIWLYSLLTLKMSDMMPIDFRRHVQHLLKEKNFDAVLTTCKKQDCFSAPIIASAISARKHGPQVIMGVVQSEGKRCGNLLWQRITLLNDIAVIAPMLGLLGTVIGLFITLYDTNKSFETISTIFDGLGIAIGTTVVGLIVAIMAMIFYTTLKFRIVNLLNTIENESLALVTLIEHQRTEQQ